VYNDIVRDLRASEGCKDKRHGAGVYQANAGMKILQKDLRHGRVRVMVENLDDLW